MDYTPSLWVPNVDPLLDWDGTILERFTGQNKGGTATRAVVDRDPADEPYMIADRYFNPLDENQITEREQETINVDYERRFSDRWSFKANYSLEDGNNDEINSDHTLFDKDLTNYRRAFRGLGTQKMESATALLFGEIPVIEDMWNNKILLGGSWYEDEYTQVRRYTSDVPGKGLVPAGEPLDFDALATVDENETGVDYNRDGTLGRIPIPVFLNRPFSEENMPFWATLINQRTSFENTAYWITNDFMLFNDRLIVRGGYRWDDFTQLRYRDAFTDIISEQGDQKSESLQYSAIYKLTPNYALYYSFSESVRDQFVFADGAVAPVVRGEGDEIGLKFSLLDGTLTGLIAYYDLTVDGKVEPSDVGGGFRALPAEDFSGFEFEITADLTSGLSIIASYAYTDAVQIIDPGESITGEFIEERVDNVPDHRASIWMRYAFNDGPLDGAYVGLGAKYIGDRTYDGTQGPFGGRDANSAGNVPWNSTFWQADWAPRPSYTTVDFLAGYKWETERFAHDLSLKIDNLFDETYIESFLKYGSPINWKIGYRVSF